jgi:hypothetical protein
MTNPVFDYAASAPSPATISVRGELALVCRRLSNRWFRVRVTIQNKCGCRAGSGSAI